MSKPGSVAAQWISGVLCLRDAYWRWLVCPIVHLNPESKRRSHRLAIHQKGVGIQFLMNGTVAGGHARDQIGKTGTMRLN
jgi:hypothetical protein